MDQGSQFFSWNVVSYSSCIYEQRVYWFIGDYVVEQSWDQITVKFYNRDYFSEFVESLMSRYPALRVWNDPRSPELPSGSGTTLGVLNYPQGLERPSES